MKPVRKLVRLALAACAGLFAGVASAVDITEDTTWSTSDAQTHASEAVSIAKDVALTVNLADAADAVTLSGVISGEGALKLTGKGALTLSAANTYTGGTILAGGYLKAGSTTAFGTAGSKITLDSTAETRLYLPDGTYDYDIDRISSSSFWFFLGGGVTFAGDIGDSTGKAGGKVIFTHITNDKDRTRHNTFSGTINLPKADLVNNCYHDCELTGKVTAALVSTRTGAGSYVPGVFNSDFTLKNAANEIGGYYMRAGNVRATVTGALGQGTGYVEMSEAVYGDGIVKLDADQTLAYLTGTHSTWQSKGVEQNCGLFTTPSGACTLTVNGTKSASSSVRLDGALSLVYEPTGIYTQAFIVGRNHATTGSLTAKTRGTLELGGATTWKNVPTVTAGAGATVLVSTTAEKPLSGVRTLNVAGTVEVAAGLANPFTEDLTKLPALNVTTGGKLKLPANTTVYVGRVTVDGEDKPYGTYTESCDWLEGDGATVKSFNYIKMTTADIKAYEGDTLDIGNGCVEFAVAKGEAVTNAVKITGDGYVYVTGAGDLALSGDNDYTGDTYLTANGAIVRAQSATAFGTGKVHVDARAYVFLQKDGATFTNDFDFTDIGHFTFQPAAAKAAMTVAGKVTGTADVIVDTSYGIDQAHSGDIDYLQNCTLTFAETVDVPNATVTFTGYLPSSGAVHFMKKVTATAVRGNHCSSQSKMGVPDSVLVYGAGAGGCPVYFHAPDNAIGRVAPYWNTYYLADDGALGTSATLTSSDARVGGFHHGASFNFGTHDQEIASLELLDMKGYTCGSAGSALKCASPLTLTVSGGGTYAMDWKINDSLSFNWNPPNAGDTLIVSNVAHTTSGKLTVSKGTFCAVGAAGKTVSFANLTAIEVKEGATFKLDTETANALTAVKSVVIRPGGVLEIVRGATPFGSAKATVEIMTNETAVAKIKLAQDVVAKFALVYVNGESVPNATYTSAKWLEGAGSVEVDSTALADNTWLNAKSGTWSTAANWSKVEAPSTKSPTAINRSGASYTVSLTENAGTIGRLAIENAAAGQTTTLNVAAPVKVDYNTDAVNIGKGALVEVAENGEFVLSRGSVNDSSAVRVNVYDGGEFKVCGGTAVFTNCAGKVQVGKDGKVTITSGTLLTRPSAAPYYGGAMTVDDGGTLEMTSGQLLFSAFGWNYDGLVIRKGGRLDVSGDAVVGPLDGMTYTRVFGDGEMTFRGNSVFGRSGVTGGVGGWGYCFATGSGAPTGTVTFLEHATFNDTASSLKIDRGAGTVAQLLLYSDATHKLNWSTYLGAGDGGRGELVITNGVVTQGGPGLRLGGAYEKQGATTALNSEGYLRVAGTGSLNVYGGNTATDSSFCGLVVGDGSIAVTNKTTGLCYEDHMTGYLELADSGAITFGSSAAFIVGVGNPNAFGRFTQTGGAFTDTSESDYGRAVVGMGGGTGEWLMSGGYAFIKDCLFVGGASCTNDFHRTRYPKNDGRLYVGERDYPGQAKGLLKLTGGTMTVKKDLVLSKDGEGTLELGPNANLVVEGKLDAKADSKLVVDMRGCTAQRKTLATFGDTTTAFDSANIMLKQDSGTTYELRISSTGIRVVQPMGLIMMIK